MSLWLILICLIAIIVRNPPLGEADSNESFFWLGSRFGGLFCGFLLRRTFLSHFFGWHPGFDFVYSFTSVRPVSQHTVMAMITNNANVNAVYPDAFVCPETIPEFPPTIKEELSQLLDGWPGSAMSALLEDKSKPERVEDDWITNFFDRCRNVSDAEMQRLWANVLASEANTPGAFSRKTVNIIADLDKSDAELFGNLCSFGWMIGTVVPLVFDVQQKIYNDNGINFGTLSHLESLGFIQFNNIAGYKRLGLPKNVGVFYYGTVVKLDFPNENDNEIELGHVLLTQAGQQLAPVCGSHAIPDFLKFVTDRWTAAGLMPSAETEQTDLDRGRISPDPSHTT